MAVKTVLVVGRNWKLRALLRAQLREEGFEALGFETLADAESEAADAAALLLDTTGDQPSGWQQVLRRLAAQLPAMVIAGASEEVDLPGGKVLRRPLSVADIVRAVREFT